MGGDEATSLTDRLARLQLAQIVHGYRAMILFEGWDGSGQRAALRRLAGAWDPCYFATHCDAPGDDRGRHWLARYWTSLPAAGASALFHRSWYRRLADERALGRLSDKAWGRRCDEINEFEAQQRDHGTLLVKLFFDVSATVQADRLAHRRSDPWRQWLPAAEPTPPRAAHQAAWAELFKATDTRWAPWSLIDANDGAAAERSALTVVAEALEKSVPLDPPAASEEPQRAAG